MVGIDTVMTTQYIVLFEGTREQVVQYLTENPPGDNIIVRYGDTTRVVFATEYLANPPQ